MGLAVLKGAESSHGICTELLSEEIMAFNKADGKYERDALFSKIWDGVKPFIHSLLKAGYPSYYSRYKEDMEQEAALTLFQCIGRYDPQKGAPTTYIKPYILNSAYRFVSSLGYGEGYSRNRTKIINFAAACGKDPLELQAREVSEEAGIPIQAAEGTLAMMASSYVSIDDESVIGFPSPSIGPEERAMEKEGRRIIHECVGNLDSQQKDIICLYYGFGRENSLGLEKVSDKLGLSVKQVRRRMDKACSSLRRELAEKYM